MLEFDHLGDKRASVSWMVAQGTSVTGLRKEIAACQVVCVNCHRRRTARRAGWRRGAIDWRKAPSRRMPNEERSERWVYETLERSPCVDCGVKDICVLDFDHVDGKTGHVGQLARSGYSVARLRAEVARCEVRCGNCHRRRTATERGFYRARTA